MLCMIQLSGEYCIETITNNETKLHLKTSTTSLPCDGDVSRNSRQNSQQILFRHALVQLGAQWLDEPRPGGAAEIR